MASPLHDRNDFLCELRKRAQCAIDYFASDGSRWKRRAVELEDELRRTVEFVNKQDEEILDLNRQKAGGAKSSRCQVPVTGGGTYSSEDKSQNG